jgi:hypothetical protein
MAVGLMAQPTLATRVSKVDSQTTPERDRAGVGTGGESGGASVEVPLLGEAHRPPGSLAIAGPGPHRITGALEQVGPDRVEAVVAGQAIVGPQRSQQLEPGPGPVHHRHGHSVVERGHRVGGDAQQELVEQDDLQPVGCLVGRSLVVHGGDGRLDLVRAERSLDQRPGYQGDSLGDGGRIPEGAILLRQRDENAAGAGARRPPGVGEEHEREQTGDLTIVRQEAVDRSGEADSFGRQVVTVEIGPRRRRVALVEDQIEHVQHDVQALGPRVR